MTDCHQLAFDAAGNVSLVPVKATTPAETGEQLRMAIGPGELAPHTLTPAEERSVNKGRMLPQWGQGRLSTEDGGATDG